MLCLGLEPRGGNQNVLFQQSVTMLLPAILDFVYDN